jgi:GNAT superfamily N-acetyltransferase
MLSIRDPACRPVRLGAVDAPRVLAHFKRLSPEDRTHRFWGAHVPDATLERYVQGLRFDADIVLGAQVGESLIGVAHGCIYAAHGEATVEAAFSVDEPRRGCGVGRALMRSMIEHAGLAQVRSVVGLCSLRNLRMRRVFEGAGLALTRLEDEWHAHGRLGAVTVAGAGRACPAS